MDGVQPGKNNAAGVALLKTEEKIKESRARKIGYVSERDGSSVIYNLVRHRPPAADPPPHENGGFLGFSRAKANLNLSLGTSRWREPRKRLWEQYQYLAREFYLWGQTRKWPLPAAVRTIVREVLAKTIDRSAPGTPSGADEWPSTVNTSGDDPVGLPGGNLASCATAIPPTMSAGWARSPSRPEAHPRLRCLVTTGTLNLSGLEIVAVFLGRGLLLHGFDTVVAHTPSARSGGLKTDERPVDLVHLGCVPVLELSQHDIRQWLRTNRPDVISMHSPPDWLVAAAAEAHIPCIETLHGVHSLLDRKSWRGEQVRSQQITGFVAVSELVRRQYLRANPGYPADRITTIPNGIDDQHIRLRDRTKARAWLGLSNEFLFVSLARYFLQKNTFGTRHGILRCGTCIS